MLLLSVYVYECIYVCEGIILHFTLIHKNRILIALVNMDHCFSHKNKNK